MPVKETPFILNGVSFLSNLRIASIKLFHNSVIVDNGLNLISCGVRRVRRGFNFKLFFSVIPANAA